MFQLVEEYRFRNTNFVDYKTDIDYFNLVILIEHSRYENTGYEMMEDADVGLKAFSGTFSYSQVMEIFDSFPDIDYLSTEFPELGICLYAKLQNGHVHLSGKGEIIPIEDLLGLKESSDIAAGRP